MRRHRTPCPEADALFVGGQQAADAWSWLAMVASNRQTAYTRLVPATGHPRHATWGRGESYLRPAGDPGRRQGAARRVPHRGRGHQPLPRHCGGDRLGPVGHRASHRARRADGRQRLRAQAPGRAASRRARSPRPPSVWRIPPRPRAVRGAVRAHYAASREWEEREFRRAVTDWELARYFEII